LNAREEILLDIDEMAKGHTFYNVSGFEISEDNKLIAYGVDEVSRNQFTIYVKDLSTGVLYKDTVMNTTGNAVWANDNKTFSIQLKMK